MNVPVLPIFSCSPRPGGNGHAAALLLQQGAAEAGLSTEVVPLRDHPVLPCLGCEVCATVPGRCALDGQDHAARLFARLAEAPALMFTLPVYFYGPPAQCKALIDRAQVWWWREGVQVPPATRPVFVVITAARIQGPRLFDASLLILRCFFRTLGFSLHPPLLLRGLEGPDALLNEPQTCERVLNMGREAGIMLMRGQNPTPGTEPF